MWLVKFLVRKFILIIEDKTFEKKIKMMGNKNDNIHKSDAQEIRW